MLALLKHLIFLLWTKQVDKMAREGRYIPSHPITSVGPIQNMHFSE